MSLVRCKERPQIKMVNLEEIFQDRLSSLGIREIFAPRGLMKAFETFHIKRCRKIMITHHQQGEIIIFSSAAKEKLMALDDPLREEYFANLSLCKAALLIFSQSMTLPGPLKKLFKHYDIPVAISSHHEDLLESRIKEIIQEKINQCVTVHGVALEIQGRGILITGASGIGKTTSAIQMISEGSIWIADDRAVIKKNNKGQLIISGHRKIKKYFHTGETGIMAVDRMFNASQIKNKTTLIAVIDVNRTDADDVSFQCTEKNILEARLPCMRMRIPCTGYLDKNLLKKAVQKLKEVV